MVHGIITTQNKTSNSVLFTESKYGLLNICSVSHSTEAKKTEEDGESAVRIPTS